MSRGSDFRKKVLACEQLCGTHTALNHPSIAKIFGEAGFDYVWVDSEHTDVSGDMLASMITAVQSTGTPVLVRVPMNDLTPTKHTLEMGPDAILFPMVSTAEQAKMLMDMCLYPPLGTRGLGPLLAFRYGRDKMEEYLAKSYENLTRFVQIESDVAVRNLPEIVKNPHIDGYVFGPCDMSGSINHLFDVFCEENVALMKEAVHILRDNGKSIGVSTGSYDPKVQQIWHDLGVNMITTGVDFAYLMDGCDAALKSIRAIQAK